MFGFYYLIETAFKYVNLSAKINLNFDIDFI